MPGAEVSVFFLSCINRRQQKTNTYKYLSDWKKLMSQRWVKQGEIKSVRNSYLNTGSFHKNLIWIWGVLKKSIFAYLKFNICIPKIWYLHTKFIHHRENVKVNISWYHLPYDPCPNFSVPASVKAKSSLVDSVFHQIGKVTTSGILVKGDGFWQGPRAKPIPESISESYLKYVIKTFVWLFPVATHL